MTESVERKLRMVGIRELNSLDFKNGLVTRESNHNIHLESHGMKILIPIPSDMTNAQLPLSHSLQLSKKTQDL